jgi:hypothetical protein
MARLNLDKEKYRDLVTNSTKPIEVVNNFPNGQPIAWLSEQIYNGKRKLNYNSVDFIVLKILNRKENLLDYGSLDFMNVIVIGTFKSEFIPTVKVAEAFAEFYLEMKVLPNIILMTKKEFFSNISLSINRIRNGVLIYDRERNLH